MKTEKIVSNWKGKFVSKIQKASKYGTGKEETKVLKKTMHWV